MSAGFYLLITIHLHVLKGISVHNVLNYVSLFYTLMGHYAKCISQYNYYGRHTIYPHETEPKTVLSNSLLYIYLSLRYHVGGVIHFVLSLSPFISTNWSFYSSMYSSIYNMELITNVK